MLVLPIAVAGLLALPQPQPQNPPPAPAAEPAKKTEPVVEKLKAEAAKLAPLVKSPLAKAFLDAVPKLPDPGTRTIYRTKDRSVALTAADWAKLPTEKQAEYTPRVCTPDFFYYTGYGSPLVYTRVVDLMAQFGITSLDHTKVMDFGYGTIGQLRLMAEMGAMAHGVEVEPMFAALYSQPQDLDVEYPGAGQSPFVPSKGVKLHTGRWPADKPITDAVGGAYDVITSKNTLKAGYIHPNPPKGKTVDEKMLVKLGVDDAAFLKAVHDSLKPGGLFIIYNICPAQSPAEDLTKPYIPYADGKSPFTKDQFETANLEVLAFNIEDNDWVLDCWTALGYDEAKPRAEAAKEIFSWYTVTRRKD